MKIQENNSKRGQKDVKKVSKRGQKEGPKGVINRSPKGVINRSLKISKISKILVNPNVFSLFHKSASPRSRSTRRPKGPKKCFWLQPKPYFSKSLPAMNGKRACSSVNQKVTAMNQQYAPEATFIKLSSRASSAWLRRLASQLHMNLHNHF